MLHPRRDETGSGRPHPGGDRRRRQLPHAVVGGRPIAAEAGAKCLVLNHFVPVKFDKAALLAEVRAAYAGPIIIGEDLMSLALDAGMLGHAGGVSGLRS